MRRALLTFSVLLAVLAGMATVVWAQVEPLPPADTPPPAGPAYVLSSPNDPAWLMLVTRAGRWAIEVDQHTCGPAVLPPASQVSVTLEDDVLGTAAVIRPMMITPAGQVVPDPGRSCEVTAALFASSQPCAEINGQCDIAAEAAYEPQRL